MHSLLTAGTSSRSHERQTLVQALEKVGHDFLFEEHNTHIFLDPVSSTKLNRITTEKAKL